MTLALLLAATLGGVAAARGAGARGPAIVAAARAAEARHGLPAVVTLAVVEVESRYQPGAVSSAGCLGLMQLAPATAAWVARGLGVRGYRLDAVEGSVRLGAAYLTLLVARYGSLAAGLTAYNVGPGAFERSGLRVNAYARRVLRVAGEIVYDRGQP